MGAVLADGAMLDRERRNGSDFPCDHLHHGVVFRFPGSKSRFFRAAVPLPVHGHPVTMIAKDTRRQLATPEEHSMRSHEEPFGVWDPLCWPRGQPAFWSHSISPLFNTAGSKLPLMQTAP